MSSTSTLKAPQASASRPRPAVAVRGLERVLASWRASLDLQEPNPPALRGTIAYAEKRLGRRLPRSLRALYTVSDGGSFLEGNFELEPLAGLPRLNRSFSSLAPRELLLFGTDGSDSVFGLWIGRRRGEPVVVEMDEGGGGLALVGTSLARFLVGRTAFFLENGDRHALAVLGVPRRLRFPAFIGSDAQNVAIVEWADPALPDPRAEPYRHGTTAARLRARYG